MGSIAECMATSCRPQSSCCRRHEIGPGLANHAGGSLKKCLSFATFRFTSRLGLPEAGHPLRVAFNLVIVVAGVATTLGIWLRHRVYGLAQGGARQWARWAVQWRKLLTCGGRLLLVAADLAVVAAGVGLAQGAVVRVHGRLGLIGEAGHSALAVQGAQCEEVVLHHCCVGANDEESAIACKATCKVSLKVPRGAFTMPFG